MAEEEVPTKKTEGAWSEKGCGKKPEVKGQNRFQKEGMASTLECPRKFSPIRIGRHRHRTTGRLLTVAGAGSMERRDWKPACSGLRSEWATASVDNSLQKCAHLAGGREGWGLSQEGGRVCICGGWKVPGEWGRRQGRTVSDGTGPGESWDGIWSGAGGDKPRTGGRGPDGEVHTLEFHHGLDLGSQTRSSMGARRAPRSVPHDIRALGEMNSCKRR